MIWQDIVEARSNPDKNPRQHILTELSKYEGQKDLFVSFTASFDTRRLPPLEQGQPPRKPNKRINGDGVETVKNPSGQNKMGINPQSKWETPIGIYTYPLDYVLQYSKEKGEFTAPFTGDVKNGYLYVVRLATDEVINEDSDIGPLFSKIHDLAIDTLGEVEGNTLVGEAIQSAKDLRDPRSKCWNLGRLLAARLAGKPGFAKSAPVAWNVIMRKCGVQAYVDDGGRGIIHTNEPTQAVFFTSQAFRVVDAIAFSEQTIDARKRKADDEKYIMQGIKKRTLDVNKINPLMLRGLIRYRDVEPDDLEWIASKLDTLPKRIVNESIDRWPTGLTFDNASIKALRAFGPLRAQMLIDIGVTSFDGTYADFPTWLDRQPTDDEWREIFTGYQVQGIDPNMKLMQLKAPWVNERWLLNTFKARLNRFPDVGILAHCAEQNGVPFDGKLLEEAFVRAPARILKSYPKHQWTFPQWYRAMRTTHHMENDLGNVIPLEVAMPILMRDDRATFMNRDLLKRLIAEKPEFVAVWFPKHGAQMWHQSFPELNNFVAEYLPVMAARAPDMLRFLTVEKGKKPDPRVLSAIWRDLALDGQFAVRTVEWACKQGWITQDDFAKHLSPKIAHLIEDFGQFGWGYVEDDLWVDAMVMANDIPSIAVDQIPTLMRRHPEKLQQWSGRMSAVDARELFDEYPEARTNQSVLRMLDAAAVYEFWQNGKLNFSTLHEQMKFAVINAALLHDPHAAEKLDDVNGPFVPLPTDYTEWRTKVSIANLNKGGAYGMKARDEFAWLMVLAYGNEVDELQLEVSRAVMEKLISRNLNHAVMTHPFGNMIPDDLLGPAQIAFVEKNTADWKSRNLPLDNLHDIVVMLFSKMAKPTQMARMKYADILHPPTQNS